MSDAARLLPDASLDELIERLGRASPPEQRAVADELVRLAPGDGRIESRVRQRLEDREIRVRRAAAFTLARLEASAAGLVPVLIEALGDGSSEVRWGARHALILLQRTANRVLPALLDAARASEPVLRRMAFYCLRDFPGGAERAEVDARMLAALTDPVPEVRLAALSAAARIGGESSPLLAAMLAVLEADPTPGVRRAAALALSKRGKDGRPRGAFDSARGALERAARDPDPHLRKAALAGLEWLGSAASGE